EPGVARVDETLDVLAVQGDHVGGLVSRGCLPRLVTTVLAQEAFDVGDVDGWLLGTHAFEGLDDRTTTVALVPHRAGGVAQGLRGVGDGLRVPSRGPQHAYDPQAHVEPGQLFGQQAHHRVDVAGDLGEL